MSHADTESSGHEQLNEAIKILKSANEHSSLKKMAADLEKTFKRGVEKSSVGRWIRYNPKQKKQPRIEANILKAAEFFKNSKEVPVQIRMATIASTTEMLPAHLIKDYPEWESELNIHVVMEEKSSISEVLGSLKGNQVDVAIAPRFTKESELKGSIQPFFEIALIPVSGLFPFKISGFLDFASKLHDMTKAKQKVGVLPNANYWDSLNQFMQKYHPDHLAPPDFEIVKDHATAVEALKSEKIHGLVGHEVFVSNCKNALGEYKKITPENHTGEWFPLIGGVLPPVAMDVFVNIKNENFQLVARKALHLLHKAVKAMEKHDDQALTRRINEILNLNAGDAMSAKGILDNDYFHVRQFYTQVVLMLLEL